MNHHVHKVLHTFRNEVAKTIEVTGVTFLQEMDQFVHLVFRFHQHMQHALREGIHFVVLAFKHLVKSLDESLLGGGIGERLRLFHDV